MTIVLLSGGLDSAVLAAHEAQSARVLPLYVSVIERPSLADMPVSFPEVYWKLM